MEESTAGINNCIQEIERFSEKILTLNLPPATDQAIAQFEKRHQLTLPADYKILLKKYNGVILYGTEIYGIDTAAGIYSLDRCYSFEHYEVEREMPSYLVPFSPDGFGNHYCFDTRFHDETSCPVIFWQHDYDYADRDNPEITNAGLAGWIQREMIEWTLEDYHHDGSEK